MSPEPVRKEATLASYATGFVLSLVFTFTAFLLVLGGALHGAALAATLLALALAQLVTQMVFFLAIGAETGRRWKLQALAAAFGMVLVIVVASIWIMGHLNYSMMASPDAMRTYIQSQQGF